MVWRAIEEYGVDPSFIQEIVPAIQDGFDSYGFSLFDFSNPDTLNSLSKEFLDSSHGSEKTYLRLIIEMAEHDPVLQSYVDLPFLKQSLRESKEDLTYLNQDT